MIGSKKALTAAMLLSLLVACGPETMQTSSPVTGGGGGAPAAGAGTTAAAQGPSPTVMAAFSDLQVVNRINEQASNPHWVTRIAEFRAPNYVATDSTSSANSFYSLEHFRRVSSLEAVEVVMRNAMTSRGLSSIEVIKTLPITHPTAYVAGHVIETRAISQDSGAVTCVYARAAFGGMRPPGDRSELQWSTNVKSGIFTLLCGTGDTAESVLRRIQSIQGLRS